MKNDLQQLLKNGYIFYDPYSDLFQIYDNMVFILPGNQLQEKTSRNFRTVLYRQDSRPLLFEVKRAYDTFGINLDNLSRTSIIKLIEPYLSKYV